MSHRTNWRVVKNALALAALLCALLVLATVAGGCKSSKVKGGESQKASNQLYVEITPGKVIVQDDRQHQATTQPSAEATGSTPRTGEGSIDVFGTVGFDTIKSDLPQRAAVAGLFLLLAAGFWFLGRRVVPASLCIGLAACAFLYPAVFLYGTVVMAGYLVYINRDQLLQVRRGVNKALKNLPPDEAQSAEGYMDEELDAHAKRVIKG